MQRLWLAAALLGFLGFLGPACMKASAPPGVPVMVVPVAAVNGPAIAIGGAADAPHPAQDLDTHAAGDRVEVESQGSWLPATLIERRGDRWLVHYDEAHGRRGAMRDNGEEIVQRERIRVPVQPIEEDMGPDDVDP